MIKVNPKSGRTYTLREITERLDLRDAPCLQFTLDGNEAVRNNVQDSHMTTKELLSVLDGAFADTEWRYEYETFEWVPVFTYIDRRPITDFVDMEPYTDPFEVKHYPGTLWVVPKGFPRSQ